MRNYFCCKTRFECFLMTTSSVPDAAAFNLIGNSILVNGFSTFPIKDNPFFSNNTQSLNKNPLDCPILCN